MVRFFSPPCPSITGMVTMFAARFYFSHFCIFAAWVLSTLSSKRSPHPIEGLLSLLQKVNEYPHEKAARSVILKITRTMILKFLPSSASFARSANGPKSCCEWVRMGANGCDSANDVLSPSTWSVKGCQKHGCWTNRTNLHFRCRGERAEVISINL